MKTLKEMLVWGEQYLRGSSPSPRLDAELLLCTAAGLSKLSLLTSLGDKADMIVAAKYRAFIERRFGHEPVAYITGVKEFWGLEFAVSPQVLVPRPETELLVEGGLRFLEGRPDACILDLGTGSGCIAVSLAWSLKSMARNFEMVAVDLSTGALQVARENAARHGVLDVIDFRRSDWFSQLRGKPYDLIVCNPPYLAKGEKNSFPDLAFEPELALYAGESGTEVVELLLAAVPEFLAPGGVFMCEIGAGQDEKIHAPGGKEIVFLRDLAGINRVAVIGTLPVLFGNSC